MKTGPQPKYKRRSKFVGGTPDVAKLEEIADWLADQKVYSAAGSDLGFALEIRRAAAWIRERVNKGE